MSILSHITGFNNYILYNFLGGLAASADSDDDRPMEEIIEKSSTGQAIIIRKPLPEGKEKNIKKLVGPGGIKLYKRKMRCKKCEGCLATDCGQCKHCL